jgi:hypothetical protein
VGVDPVKTGKEWGGEGVAIRIGPEPCVGTREGVGETSVGEGSLKTSQGSSTVHIPEPRAVTVRR